MYIEVNGPHHRTEERASRDYRRDATLSERGWKKRAFTEKDVDRDVFACAKIIEADYLKLKNGSEVKTQESHIVNKSRWLLILGAVVLLAAISAVIQNLNIGGKTEPSPTLETGIKNTYPVVGTIERMQERTSQNGANFWILAVAGKLYYVWDASIGTRLEAGKAYRFTVENGRFPRIVAAEISETAKARV
ncbi:hypothetical protein HY995_01690 [Candidatus Micrarchaeota archaeon]|nr:hypothetical protein [Candidatus Micrarchaeota archaeon]MBI5176780.1 hypothetical protein [Candidatus Micrarchaeota archaeon]